MQKWGAFDNVPRTLPGDFASHLVMLLPLLLPLHTAAQRLGDVIPRVQLWFTCVPRGPRFSSCSHAFVLSQEPTTRRPFSLVQLADLDALAARAGAKVKGSLVTSYHEGQDKYRERRERRCVVHLVCLCWCSGVRSPFLCSGFVSPGSGWCRGGSGVACFVSTTRWSYVGQSMLHSSRPLRNKKTRRAMRYCLLS